MAAHGQDGFDVRFGWGPTEAALLGAAVDALVVVDVLRFTTAVEAAVGRGVDVEPRDWRRGQPREGPYSLSPRSVAEAPPGIRVVLPSPNGSRISAAAAGGGATVHAACLRNASAVAAEVEGSVAVIAAGERWPDGGLRPCIEDLLGAGAVLAGIDPARSRSPEARAAAATFASMAGDLPAVLHESASGRELAEKGLEADVEWAAQLDVSRTVPVLRDGAFTTLP